MMNTQDFSQLNSVIELSQFFSVVCSD